MDVSHETPDVTTKPKCYDLTKILVPFYMPSRAPMVPCVPPTSRRTFSVHPHYDYYYYYCYYYYYYYDYYYYCDYYYYYENTPGPVDDRAVWKCMLS